MPLKEGLACDEIIKAAGVMIKAGDRILLLKRRDTPEYDGLWALPGGKIEEGETPAQAAKRETAEETGFIDLDQLQQIDFTQNGNVEFTTFLASAEQFNPVLNEEHNGSMWVRIDKIPDNTHPGVIKTLELLRGAEAMDESARTIDMNGYISIPKNPISRSGVFQYLGKSISADAQPDKIYNVYRPAEELSHPEAIASFKMIPLIDDHEMLGTKQQGYRAAETKGVHGTTGEELEFRDGVLYSNLKIFSQTLRDMVQQGKKDLSLGYRCVYEKASGVFNGEAYDYVQRKLRGNHLALVKNARCDVSVLDHSITFDHFDLTKGEDTMTEEEKKAKEAADKAVRDAKDAEEAETKKKEEEKTAKDAEEAAEKEKKDKEAKDAEELKDDTKQNAMDSAELKRVSAELAEFKKNSVKSVMSEITARDALAKDLSNYVGTFDHSEMTVDEVAAYGVKTLKLNCGTGQEKAVLGGYLQAAKKSSTGFAMDSKPASSQVDAYLKQAK